MKSCATKKLIARVLCATFTLYFGAVPATYSYSFAYTVADMRQPSVQSGGTACPQPDHWNPALAGGINIAWSTSLPTNPSTVITADQTPGGQLNEIQATITQAFGVWTGVAGTSLTPASLAALTQNSTQDACDSSDGLNTICFNQADPSFTTGVVAFTRVTSADIIGVQPVPNHPPSTFIGEIVDADILFNPTESQGGEIATPAALATNPQAYDLESVLLHEMGHFFGFEHTAVWSAAMFPFVPAPGTFFAPRPTAQTPDAPLSDDDRTGLRVLYPNSADTTHVGVIAGHILPANPLSLALELGATGIFASQVVAVDGTTGAVVAAVQGGWSCSDPGPPVFDGSYAFAKLAVSATQTYQVYVEPFTGPESASDVASNLVNLCRNSTTDANWPAQFACAVPNVTVNFMARIRPPD
jgi:hypothetical protein